MSKTLKVFNACCCSICGVGIIIFIWAYIERPGLYSGSLNGDISIYPPDESEEYYIHNIQFEAKTTSEWRWNKPKNFHYDHIDITLNDKRSLTVFFPSLRCTHEDEEDKFSKPFLSDMLSLTSETGNATISPEQLDKLYSFILSAGNGTIQHPGHHPYHFDSPYLGTFTHFCLGGSGWFLLAGISMLAIGIILNFFGTIGEPKRFTVMSVVVLANYGLFFLGIYLNRYGGFVDTVGAFLCRTSHSLGILLIPISIIYSFMRRFSFKIEKWDFFGVSLAILLFLIAMLFTVIP